MDLRQAQTFVAVCEELSFRAAAERLRVSPPTVSDAVKRLERELGTRLFIRTSRSVALTGAAAQLLPVAQDLLAAHGTLTATEDVLRRTEHLVIGTLFGLGAELCQRAADSMRAHGHQIEMEVRAFDWGDPTCGLRTHLVDAALLGGPTRLDREITREQILIEQRVVLVPVSSPYAGATSLTLEEVDDIGWVRVFDGDSRWHQFWRLDEERGGPPVDQIGPVLTSPNELLAAVRSDRGTCSTLASFGRQFNFEDLVLIPMEGVPPVSIELGYWPGQESRCTDQLITALQSAAADSPDD